MRDMNKATALFCTRIILGITLLVCGSLVLASCAPGQLFGPTLTPTSTDTPTPSNTPTPTNTPMPTNTPTPSNTPTPTNTATPTNTPAPTLSPTPTLVPVQVSVANCSTANIQQGRGVWSKGYLVVPAGSYNRNASSYSIWLRATQFGDARMTVKVLGGDKSNSMYFASGKPHIKDNRGRIIPWVSQGGREIYITNRSVTVRGTWLGECSVEIKVIE
jgi:hypothetical protein